MNNLDVRREIKNAGLFHYAVADELGISETTFCRMLRKELPLTTKQKIYAAVGKLKDGGKQNAEK